MGKVKRIMIHCTGEPDNATRNRAYYTHWFFDVQGWHHFGYHVIVYQNGSYNILQPIPKQTTTGGVIDDSTMANGCKGANMETVHIAYVGGIDHTTGKPADTRTLAQKDCLLKLVQLLKQFYKIKEVIGHHDWPGVTKACPCFDAKKEYANV